jgi:diadenylate cyclase
MREFFTNLSTGFGINDVIDIAIIAFVVYKILGFLRETRAEQLVKGLLVLIAVTFLSGVLHLYALNWLLNKTMQFGVIALVIVFQPELRRALEFVGRSRILRPQFGVLDKEKAKSTVAAIIKASDYFSVNKVGALIIIEREISLTDFAETGVVLDSDVSTEILKNIFYVGAPLHDGAAIIRGDRVHAAGCVLPLTRNKNLSTDLGTRHRAGIGMSEVSDALSIIISEETGIISIALDGKLTRFLDIRELEKKLLSIYLDSGETKKNVFLSVFGRKKNAQEQ